MLESEFKDTLRFVNEDNGTLLVFLSSLTVDRTSCQRLPDCKEGSRNEVLVQFYRTFLTDEANCPCPSERVQRITISFNQDVVYAVTNGLEKTPKHVLLPYAIKSLTRNVELIHTLNRFGHGISYSKLEELEELDTALCLQKLSLVENKVCPAVLPLVEKTKQRSISADRYMLIFFRKHWKIMGFVTGPIGSFTGMQLLYVCPDDKDYQSQLATIRICFPKREEVDSSALPLCDDSLMQHIRRANYQAGICFESAKHPWTHILRGHMVQKDDFSRSYDQFHYPYPKNWFRIKTCIIKFKLCHIHILRKLDPSLYLSDN
ncbi:hypothetical protein GQR58_002942 [Nymphon striatum]|nr:hypothetical protein GQR58_002942 [Nymphon striatum]